MGDREGGLLVAGGTPSFFSDSISKLTAHVWRGGDRWTIASREETEDKGETGSQARLAHSQLWQ